MHTAGTGSGSRHQDRYILVVGKKSRPGEERAITLG